MRPGLEQHAIDLTDIPPALRREVLAYEQAYQMGVRAGLELAAKRCDLIADGHVKSKTYADAIRRLHGNETLPERGFIAEAVYRDGWRDGYLAAFADVAPRWSGGFNGEWPQQRKQVELHVGCIVTQADYATRLNVSDSLDSLTAACRALCGGAR